MLACVGVRPTSRTGRRTERKAGPEVSWVPALEPSSIKVKSEEGGEVERKSHLCHKR